MPEGMLVGAAGWRHGTFPPDAKEEVVTDLKTPIDFTNPDFAFTLRMENSDKGVSRFYYSYDRGHTWKGPFRLPLFGQAGIMARTDFVVNGPRDCHVFLTAAKPDEREGRPLAARTTDGGLTWTFLGYIGPEPEGYAIMPATVRVGPKKLVSAIRCRAPHNGKSWIEAYASDDDGKTWTFLNRAVPDAGEGNPASLVRLADGRLVLVYGHRDEPFGIFAITTADDGKTWTKPFALREDGGGRDIGYPRSVVRPDGKIVSIYYYHDTTGPTRYIGATIWDPGTK